MQTEKLFQLANGHWILPSSVVNIYVWHNSVEHIVCFRCNDGFVEAVPLKTQANAIDYCRAVGKELNELRTPTKTSNDEPKTELQRFGAWLVALNDTMPFPEHDKDTRTETFEGKPMTFKRHVWRRPSGRQYVSWECNRIYIGCWTLEGHPVDPLS